MEIKSVKDPKPWLRIGTCGWSYSDWYDVFYPRSVRQIGFLSYYSTYFSTVEIDSSFYRVPTPETVEGWLKKTPASFIFSGKIPQEVTHTHHLDLQKSESTLHLYRLSIAALEQQQRMVGHLLQLPPSFHYQTGFNRLQRFLYNWQEWRDTEGKTLCPNVPSTQAWRLIVEFRHRSWIKPSVFDLLRQYNAIYCAVVEPEIPKLLEVTQEDLLYLRFHGFGTNPWWNYHFSLTEIQNWASLLQDFHHQHPSTQVMGYFNNHFSGNAVKNAQDLESALFEAQTTKENIPIPRKPKNSLDRWI